jgi:hypothetical protein
MRIPFNKLVSFILYQSQKLHIDESHSLHHALNTLDYAKQIYNAEFVNYPYLQKQQNIIYTSALLHDMCDSKYVDNNMDELDKINSFLLENQYHDSDVSTICKIIDSMSYSKVCKFGFPNLKEYQTAYHIVREADLLCGYDFNRAILFGIHQRNLSYTDSFYESKRIYQERIDNIVNKHMFVTAFGQSLSNELYKKELEKIECLEQML